MENKMGISSPWVIYAKKLMALFGEDPEIEIAYDNEKPEVKLFVESASKSDALTKLLPAQKEFGGVVLKIQVISANKKLEYERELFSKAFADNPALCFIHDVKDVFSNPITYLVFKKEVVQYYADNMADAHGLCSTLYQDLAADIFGERAGIFFCTKSTAEGAK